MLKFIAKTFVITSLALTMLSTVASAEDNVGVMIDGEVISFGEVAPYLSASEGRTLFPLRALGEVLDAKVEWDDEDRNVIITKEKNEIVLHIGDKFAMKNGQKIEFDAPARIVSDRTYLPLRAISEMLDCTVSWDSTDKMANISTITESVDEGKSSYYGTDARPEVSKDAVTELASIKHIIPTLDVLSKPYDPEGSVATGKYGKFKIEENDLRDKIDISFDYMDYPDRFGMEISYDGTQELNVEDLVKVLLGRYCGNASANAYSVYQNYATMPAEYKKRTVVTLNNGGACEIEKRGSFGIAIYIYKSASMIPSISPYTPYATTANPPISENAWVEMANIKQIVPNLYLIGDSGRAGRFRLSRHYGTGGEDIMISVDKSTIDVNGKAVEFRNVGLSLHTTSWTERYVPSMETLYGYDKEGIMRELIERYGGTASSKIFAILQRCENGYGKPEERTSVKLPDGGTCDLIQWKNGGITIDFNWKKPLK